MQRMTQTEYRMRLAWLRQQWEQPSRSDYYLMRIIQVLEALWTRTNKLRWPLEQFILKFGSSDSDPRQGEQRQQQSRSAWRRRLAGGRRG